ncbi:MAG: outer membrane protein assembly factor BamA [Gemmatimonadales bacterium]
MRRAILLFLLVLCAAAFAPLSAQDTPPPPPPPIDSIVVEGAQRVPPAQVIATSGLVLQQRPSYRDFQSAVTALFRSGQYDDVQVDQRQSNGKFVIVLRVVERPLQGKWDVNGNQKVPLRDISDRIRLIENRPIDRAAIEHARFAIDSLYREKGYLGARVSVRQEPQADGHILVSYDIVEGSRIVVSRVDVEGSTAHKPDDIVGHMATRPEGFWWWQSGEYDEDRLEEDMRAKLPAWYASLGHIDFQVTGDSIVADSTRGKGVIKLTVDEGPQYRVGTFDLTGNRRYSREELMGFFPFGTVADDGRITSKAPFDRSRWEKATDQLQSLYANTGYIYSQVVPEEVRRVTPEGEHFVDLRWTIREGQVATVNRINIVGNDVTHEPVIREAIVLLPGQVFNRDLLLRSWQNIGNIGFFQQPLPAPDVQPSENRVDVDITFRVEERRTGNVNFGASLGQGTGVGGFLGLEEPNLFGRGKRGRLQWQFGRNIRDFNLSYTDPNIKESRISGTVSVFDSRARYVVGDLGRRQARGFNLQAGFPFLSRMYTRLFVNYGLQRIQYSGGSADLRARFQCEECVRSTLGTTVLKDTRVGLPFPTGGTMVRLEGELNGGFLGGTGNFQKMELEGRWYAPLATLGGDGQMGSGVQLLVGLSARSGVIFGDAGPFYTELYSMGGVQFGIPLRGYPEFSITPNGYDARAQTNTASSNAFGKSFAAFNVTMGARVSQFLNLSLFLDAGNNYRSAAQYDPTRLFRGAGAGVAVVSPLGPIGVDMAYGFDRTDLAGRPKPGWQLHFRVGNFF